LRPQDQSLPPHPTKAAQGITAGRNSATGKLWRGAVSEEIDEPHPQHDAWPGQAGEQDCVPEPTPLPVTQSIWSLAELQNSRVTSFCTSASCYLQRGSWVAYSGFNNTFGFLNSFGFANSLVWLSKTMLAALEKKSEAFNKAPHSLLAQSWDLRAHLLLRENQVWEEGKTAPSHRAAGMVRTLAHYSL